MQVMQNGWRNITARKAKAIAFVLACMPALSACETFFEAEAVRDYPVEGKLVDIGGRRIQIDCRGEGGPTVVFQSGGDMLGSLGWKPVMEKVSARTRACAYSRAGILWSDPQTRNIRTRGSRRRSSRRAGSGWREAALCDGRTFTRRALQPDLRRALSRRGRGHGVRGFLSPRSGATLPRSRACRQANM
jgi:hypothetical protein